MIDAGCRNTLIRREAAQGGFMYKTGAMCGAQGPEVGEVLALLAAEDGDVAQPGALVPLPQRIERLRAWLAAAQQ